MQLSARQRVLAPDALDEVAILVAEAATPIRLPIASAILDERPDREPANDLMQFGVVT